MLEVLGWIILILFLAALVALYVIGRRAQKLEAAAEAEAAKAAEALKPVARYTSPSAW
jgi:Na+-transporting methylmalonyl-CoA/oxaloacetate decarboxylase gamma subunit